MASDLTPQIVSMHDTHTFERGSPRAVTRLVYYLGKYGPFEADFDRAPSQLDIENEMQRRRDTLPRGA